MRGDETFAEQMARIDALFAWVRVDQERLAEKARQASKAMAPFCDAFRKMIDPVCDYSYLRESQCAHCCGHKLDPDLEEVVDA